MASSSVGTTWCAWPLGAMTTVPPRSWSHRPDTPPAGQGPAAGQDHRRPVDHHQRPGAVHQHGRLRVPVALGADVHAGDDDDDLASGLGELDQPSHHRRAPVHVLGARGHRDPRPARHRHPLEWDPLGLGPVDGGQDAAALGLGDRAQAAGRVTAQPHAAHRVPVRCQMVGHDPGGDAAGPSTGSSSSALKQPSRATNAAMRSSGPGGRGVLRSVIRATGSVAARTSPTSASHSTRPSTVARTCCSHFIDSTTSRGWPTGTWSPGSARRATTNPG